MSRLENKPWVRWLVLAVIVTALISGVTLARYQTTVTGTGTATVALPVADAGTLTFSSGELKPGGSSTFTFAVTNFTGSEANPQVSEVSQDYIVTVGSTENLPLAFTLSSAAVSPTTGGGNGVSGLGTSPTTTGSLPHTTAATHTYTLTATWPADKNEAALADEVDLITVTVTATQTTPQATS